MAGQAVVGSLRVDLGLNRAEFTRGLSDAQRELLSFSRTMQTIGASIRNVGLGLSVAVTAPLVAMASSFTRAARESADAGAQVRAALQSMGAASGRTAEQLEESARQLQHMSTYDDDDILRRVTANLLTFGNVSGDVFDRAQVAIVNLSTRMGGDLQQATIQIGRALNDPIRGVQALTRVGVAFDGQQRAQIATLVRSGRGMEAQRIILRELEHEFGGAAQAARDATPGADAIDAWRTLSETMGAIILDAVAPLLSGLARLTERINALPQGVQRAIVLGAGIAAAFGPALVAIGSLTQAIGAIVPLFAADGAIMTGVLATLGPAFAAVVPFILPVAGALAAVGVAFYAMRDQLIPVLQGLWNSVQQNLGPAFLQVWDAVKGAVTEAARVFMQVVNGPFGQGVRQQIAFLGELYGVWMRVFGEGVIAVVRMVADALTATFRVIGGLLTALSRLLDGDFAGAWDAASGAVDIAVNAILNGLNNLLPGSRAILEGLFSVVQSVFQSIAQQFDWIGQVAGGIVTAFAGAFSGAIQWAQNLYNGVRAWIVDRLGPVFAWLAQMMGQAVAWSRSGAPAPANAPSPQAPAAPTPPRTTRPPVPNFDEHERAGGGRRRRERQHRGRDTEEMELQARIELARARGEQDVVDRLQDQLEVRKRAHAYIEAGWDKTRAQATAEREVRDLATERSAEYARHLRELQEGLDLQIAQARGDFTAQRTLESQRELRERINRYRSEGVDKAEAERRAQEDVNRLDQARAAAAVRWTQQRQLAQEIALAEARGDEQALRLAQRRQDIERRTAEIWENGGKAMTLALARAQAVGEVDALGLATLQRQFRDFSSETMRATFADSMERLNAALRAGVIDMPGYTAAAREFTNTLQEGLARIHPELSRAFDGIDAITNGLRDVLTGSKDWKTALADVSREIFNIMVLEPMLERVRQSMRSMAANIWGGGEQAATDAAASTALSTAGTGVSTALTTAGTTVATAISGAGATVGTALTGASTTGATAISGAGATMAAAITAAGTSVAAAIAAAGAAGSLGGFGGDKGGGLKIPGFATGGSFEVGGQSGIDKNLVPLRLTRGERVDITPAGASRRGGDTHVHMEGAVLWPAVYADIMGKIATGDAQAVGTAVAAGTAQQSMVVRRARNRLGRG